MKTVVESIRMARRGRTPSGTPVEGLILRLLLDPEVLSVKGFKRAVNDLVKVDEARERNYLYKKMCASVQISVAA